MPQTEFPRKGAGSRAGCRPWSALVLAAASLLLATAPFATAQCTGCSNPSFGPTGRFFSRPDPYGNEVAVGDFNGDGILDVVVLNASESVTLFLGNAAGGFAFALKIPMADNPSGLATADLNSDGKLDLVVARAGGGPDPGRLTVFFGDGAGGFSGQSDIPAPIHPATVRIADLNGDGRPDILVAGGGSPVLLLPGDGSGGFLAPISFPVPVPESNSETTQIFVEDLNNDGIMDLGILRVDGYLELVLGTGGGGFASPHYIPDITGHVVVADFNRDGVPDLAIGSQVLLGLGGGRFAPGIPIPGLPFGSSVEMAGDLDQDGIPDLIIQIYAAGLVVALGDGTGNFAMGERISGGGSPYRNAAALADFDGDGRLDLVFGTNGLLLVRGTGGGRFETPPSSPAGGYVTRVSSGDFNGDGRRDVVALISPDKVAVLPNQGNLTFGPPIVTTIPSGATGIAVGDFNGDGRADVAITMASTGPSPVILLFGDGTGHFGAPTAVSVGAETGASLPSVADINGDGHPDLLVNTGNSVWLLLGTGAGTFQPARQVAPGTLYTYFIVDVNGDAHPDLIVQTGSWMQTFLGNGAGDFTPASVISPPFFLQSVTVGDFDHDGIPDLAFSSDFNSDFAIYFGDGTGGFGRPFTTRLPWNYAGLLAGDFHGDGHTDLLFNLGGAVTIGRFDSNQLQLSSAFLADGYPILVGDFTGDGKVDLVGVDLTTSSAVWMLENTICRPRRTWVERQPSSCNTGGAPFSIQPVVRVSDDGGNPITCAQTVTASLLPGTGNPLATLSGTISIPTVSGAATFTDLSVDLPGRGYRLGFTVPGAPTAGTREFSQGLASPSITTTGATCTGGPDRFEAPAGYDSYTWKLDGSVVGRGQVLTLSTIAAGSHTLLLTVVQDGCAASNSIPVAPASSPAAPIASNNGPVPYGSTIQLSASLIAGATYHWTGPSGFASTQQNPTLPGATPALGGTYHVFVTVGGCSSSVASTHVVVTPLPRCPGCSRASFGPAARAFPTRNGLEGIAGGDFDGDGRIDVVVAENGSVEVLLGNGRGALGAGIVAPYSGGSPWRIQASDLNGDGLADAILADENGVLVFLATGGGQLAAPQRYGSGIHAIDFMLGDFNGDGRADLALIDPLASTVALLFGDGNGAFVPGPALATGMTPQAGAVADVNGDGHPDLIVVGYSSLDVWLGNGSGGFTPMPPVALPNGGVRVAVGNLGSGNVDLAVAENMTGAIRVFAGLGDGHFLAQMTIATTIPAGGSFADLRIADVDLDGQDDLVYLFEQLYVVRRGEKFVFDAPVAAGGDPGYGFVLGDFYRSDRVDAAIAAQGHVSVLRAVGTSPFASANRHPAGLIPMRVVAADFDGDGHPDVASIQSYPNPSGNPAGLLSVMRNDGTGGFAPAFTRDAGRTPADLVTADFNGDGFPDLAVLSDKVKIYLSDGAGDLLPPLDFPVVFGQSMVVGDFDGDGKKDLAVSLGSSIAILLGDGTGHFTRAADVSVPAGALSMAVADFNGDGKDDLAAGGSVFLATGSGNFTTGPFLVPPSGAAPFVAAADFNGDGKLDLVLAGEQAWFFPGNGSGGFGAAQLIGPSAGMTRLLPMDFNGDGKMDLAMAAVSNVYGGQLISLWAGNGAGGFDGPLTYAVAETAGIAAADFDGDGRVDLVVGDRWGAAVQVLPNTGCLPRRVDVTVDPACSAVGAALSPSPTVAVVDDGDNPVACETRPVQASILSGSGTPGAILSGTTSVAPGGGAAVFGSLTIDRAGSGYRLEFSDPVGKGRTSAFGVGAPPAPPVAGNSGPVCVGGSAQLTASAVAGGTYRWTGPNGFTATIRNPIVANVSASSAGPYSVTVTVNGCTSAPATTTLDVVPLPVATISVTIPICARSQGNVATVADAGPGATYVWTITNGTIVSGQGTRSLTYTAGAPGSVILGVAVTDAIGCSSSSTRTVPLTTCAASFSTVAPCRLVDTRSPAGPYGAPPLVAGGDRTFVLAGQCGIAASASAASINVTVTQPTAGGDLRLFPAGTALPLVSTINYRAGQTRANNAIVSLGAAGDFTVHCDQAAGTVQLVIDVNGWFQ